MSRESRGGTVDEFETYEKTGWERKAAPYYVSCRPITDRLIEPLLDAARVGPGTRVLDVGSGPGDVAAAAAERGAIVVGLDFAGSMVGVASRSHPGLTFVVGDAQAPPFADRSFDAIVGNFVFHHLADRPRALASWRRQLRPGGRLALTAWDTPDANRLLGLFVDATAAVGAGQPPEVPSGPPMAMTDDAYHEALSAAGFDPTSVSTIRFTLQLATTDALWSRMLASSVRTAALIAEQPQDVRDRIRRAFDRLAESYQTPAGLAVPVSVKLIAGSMQALPKVTREHHERLLRQVDLMPEVGDSVGHERPDRLRARVDELVQFLDTVLLPHIDATEHVLYPDLQRLVPCRELLRSMAAEHQEIRRLVGRLEDLRDGLGTEEPTPPALLVALRRVIFRLYAQLKIHLAEEQQCLPILEHSVTPEHADELAAALQHPGAAEV